MTQSVHASPFSSLEARLGARFIDVAGWSLPSGFGDLREEHRAARSSVAVIDRSACGRIKVTGKDRLDFLHRLCTQDLKTLVAPGRGAPAVFTNNKGRIVDLVSVFDLGDSLLLLTSPGARTGLTEWIRKYIVMDQVALTDITGEGGAFRVTGPLAPQVIRALTDVPASAIEPHRALGIVIGGIEATVMGEEAGPRPTFQVIADAPAASELFHMAVSAARALHGGPAGEEARNIMRIEDGLPEGSAELTEDYNPWEARLDGAISLTKGCYLGQEVVARLNTYDKVSKRLVGFRMGEAQPPPAGSRILADGREAGTLTSAVRSLAAGETIGLGYIRIAHEEPGTEVEIVLPDQDGRIPARVTSLPVVP